MHPKRNIAASSAVLSLVAVLGSPAASAHDIQCASTQQPAERVICDHAILNNQYDDIFSQQQALLNAGKISPAQIAAWRQARNACIDVHCIDGVFAQWNGIARSAAALAPPPTAAMPQDLASSAEAAPPASAFSPSLPAAAAIAPTSGASLVQQGSAAGIALPKPVDQQASAAAPGSAASAPAPTGASQPARVIGGASGMSIGLMLLVLFAVLFGVIFKRRRKA